MEISQIITFLMLILSIVLHEVAHGYAANWLGDPTARLAGRLSPNPLLHIDPVGSVIVPALLYLAHAPLFGWAKPVPYNPYNLTNQKWGEALVAAAGPGANFLLALIFSGIIRLSVANGVSFATIEPLAYVVFINVFLGIFNLFPIPMFDGAKVIEPFLPYRMRLGYRAIGARVESLGLFGMILVLMILVTFIGDPFFSAIATIVSLLTGIG